VIIGGIGGAMNPSFCFVAGTTVLTTLGKKAIESIQIGDTIPCVDHITGEAAEKRVVTTTVNKVNRLIELDIDGEIIQCTETYPFQVKGKGWIDACNLSPGDVIYTKDWNTATVKSVDLLELDEFVEVFNFEVEDCHTYFVGNTFVLTHNLNCSIDASDIHKSVKDSPNYRSDFVKIQNGAKKVNVNNKPLLSQLNQYGSGWKKVYSDGYLNGSKASMHYFQDVSGKVFNLKYKNDWSVLKG